LVDRTPDDRHSHLDRRPLSVSAPWPAPGLLQTFGMSAYLSQHPLWAIQLAGFAPLLIVLGRAVPEGPVRELVRLQSNPGDSPCVPV
jgi:hypothetical protein